jgi:hypothetical protein
MCVIVIVTDNNVRPDDDMIDAMWTKNPDGAGIAWREMKDGEVVVGFEKGLMGVPGRERMRHLMQTVPTPYIGHFRIASRGGVRDTLTHPFPIAKDAPLVLNGYTTGEVLFHNGDWKEWDDNVRIAAMYSNTPLPSGKWSDTRGMAYLSAIYGTGYVELLGSQKGVAFGPKTMEIFSGYGWSKVGEFFCSNNYFVPTVTTHYTGNAGYVPSGPMCEMVHCVRKDNLDSDKRCPAHPKASFPSSASNGNGTVGSGTTDAAKAPVALTGGSADTLPFLGRPQKPIYGVEIATEMFKRNQISRRKLNKLKDATAKYKRAKTPNELKRTVIALETISEKIHSQVFGTEST